MCVTFYFCVFRNDAIHSSLLTDKDVVAPGKRIPLKKMVAHYCQIQCFEARTGGRLTYNRILHFFCFVFFFTFRRYKVAEEKVAKLWSI